MLLYIPHVCYEFLLYSSLTPSTDVFLRLNRTVIPNNGLLNISDIGSNDYTALLCITNRPPPTGSATSGGNWFAPYGTRVGDKDINDVPGFSRTRGPMVVRLRRDTGTGAAAEGIYRCSVNDAESTPHSLYVGLYTSGRGIYMLLYTCNHITRLLFR